MKDSYKQKESECTDCKYYDKLNLDCGRCDYNVGMFAPRELEERVELLDNIMAEIEQITDTMSVSYNRYVNLFNVRYIINKYKEVITNNE